MIIDSHCHAWRTWPYEAGLPDALTRGSAESLIREMDKSGVQVATVVSACIEPGDSRTENSDNNEYVSHAVRRWPNRLFSFLDVDSTWSTSYHSPGAAKRLVRAIDLFRPAGIAHYVSGQDDGWLTSDEGLEFFAVAAENNLPVSIQVTPEWQGSLRRLALDLPSLTILVQHQGLVLQGPSFANNLDKVIANSDLPNVFVKFTGFHYLACAGDSYPYRSAHGSAHAIYAAYGARRLVWGSDFPASLRYMSYEESIDVVQKYCDFISPDDIKAIMGGTAAALLLGEQRVGSIRPKQR